MAPDHLYAVIIAGGSGTRLWPRSRVKQPKPFLDLIGEATMIQETQSRLLPLIPPERVLVVTNRTYVETVADQLPDVPAENLIAEPSGRGTAPAIGLAAIHLRRRDPQATMASLHADHLITNPTAFRAALAAAGEVAGEGWLVTLGIQPTSPETGYGYIERGQLIGQHGALSVYRVARFVEKPPRERAEQFLAAGTYSWNSGMFVWKVDRILEEMGEHLPDQRRALEEIAAGFGTADEAATVQRVWSELPRETTIDYGIMEKASRVAVLPVDIGWTDIGSWSTVYDLSEKDGSGNVVVGQHVGDRTTGSFIYSPHRLIATLGLDNIVVVDTGDALLICPRAQAQNVKQVVALLQKNGLTRYL
jgi:mannose-1-phosphate guanylyltransferase